MGYRLHARDAGCLHSLRAGGLILHARAAVPSQRIQPLRAMQVTTATGYAAKEGLAEQVQFVKGDFMKLAEQFGENSFDAGKWAFICFLLRFPDG